jgi:hypothetical protein
MVGIPSNTAPLVSLLARIPQSQLHSGCTLAIVVTRRPGAGSPIRFKSKRRLA